MKSFLRPIALVVAALVLPCCSTDIGSGDAVHQVTVRISRGMNGQEPNAACLNPAISADGRFVVFESGATNLAPNDGNGLVDIFLFDRENGKTINVTRGGAGGAGLVGDCTNPVVSQDGNSVGFVSIGNYAPSLIDPNPHTTRMLYVRDRTTGVFNAGCYLNGFPFDRDISEPSMSSDGTSVAFVTSANVSFFGYPNPGHIGQVYHYNWQTSTMYLCSPKTGPDPTLICAAGAGKPRISPDGEYVVFSSSSSDLVPAGPATPQIYIWSKATGTVELASLDSTGAIASNNAYLPDVSAGGRYVLFQVESSPIPGANFMAAARRDRVNLVTEAVTDHPGTVKNVVGFGYPMRMSADGRFIAYRSGWFIVGGSGIRQITVRDMLGGEVNASCHNNGTPADADCDTPGISADGRWVVFSTPATTLANDDFNGLTDIYVRGPLR